MRITMGMIAGQYSKNLNTALSNFNTAARKSTNFRSFERTSENPFAATKLYRFRREQAENQTYQDSLGDVESQLMTAQSAMQSVYSIVSSADTGDVIQAITGTMSEDDRSIIADKLRQMQKAFLSPLNTKFAESYVFGGTEMTEAPFSVSEVDGKSQLFYRGINVDTGELENGPVASFNGTLIQFGGGTITTTDGNSHTVSDGFTLKVTNNDVLTSPNVAVSGSLITIEADLSKYKTNQDLLNLLNGLDGIDRTNIHITGDLNRPLVNNVVSDQTITKVSNDDLKSLANEQVLVNLGMGLKTDGDTSTINSQSAFNSAIPGISFLGYGTTDVDGVTVSNNLYTLMGQIADKLESDDFSIDNIRPYLNQFSKQGQNLLGEITKSGSKSNFLSTMKTNLESMGDSLLERAEAIEYVDPGDAIMDFYMQQYTYNAALSMGTKILSKSFIDYMS